MQYTVHNGWIAELRHVPSPNCAARPPGFEPELLVLHNISLPPGFYGGDYIERFFSNGLDWEAHPYFQEIRGLRVSAHLLVRRCGEAVQFVSFNERAWHAGRSCWNGRDNCNDFSIGVELEGCDNDPYTDEQYDALGEISGLLLRAYPLLSEDRIVGHSEIAPGRKTDPGPAFDWVRYRQQLQRVAAAR
ncbi:MAG: 1,6-anhydro-N-acetylmuramyl-L-alanine amidase AmpD [Halioglobus sp.]|nr:1,6-anhydro-N-acetylmuramyl-L-alanine amidase AmpD [Halioglobus sp.]